MSIHPPLCAPVTSPCVSIGHYSCLLQNRQLEDANASAATGIKDAESRFADWLGSLLKATLRWGPRYQPVVVQPSGLDLEVITKLVEEGKLRPVIDRLFKLEDVRCVYCPLLWHCIPVVRSGKFCFSQASCMMNPRSDH